MDRLALLYHEGGQSPWLDNLKRSYLTGGQLANLVASGIRGLTSNPTIFQKAIQGSADYDEQHRSLIAAGGSTLDHYWAMVLSDIKNNKTEVSTITNNDRKIRVFGNVAIVTGRDTEKSVDHGKETSGTYVYTDVFLNRNGKWQAVQSHSTKLQ